MTSKEWEKQTLERDRKIQKKIGKYRSKSTRRVLLGIFVAFFAFDTLNDVIKKFSKARTIILSSSSRFFV